MKLVRGKTNWLRPNFAGYSIARWGELHWLVRELNISLTELAMRLGISVLGLGTQWRGAKTSPEKAIIS